MTNPNNDRAVLSRVIKFLIAGVFATAATLFIFSAGLASITRNTATTPPEININNAQDPWPPFWFDLIPFHENGKITYQLGLYSRVDQQMFDMVIKVPIPEGTRFLEANTPLETQAEFDGQTVTFSTIALDKYIEDISFTVEITDPTRTVFTTQPQVSWKGAFEGDYLFEPTSIDITRQPLNWQSPDLSRLQLGVGATASNNILTYAIYPKAIAKERMWDVNLEISLPKEVTFIKAYAPPPFETGFNGQTISFSTLELERQKEVGPLTFQVATKSISESAVTLPVQATWKNGTPDPIPGTNKEIGKRNEGPEINIPAAPETEQLIFNTVFTQPYLPQQIVFDTSADVPFSNYDLTGITFFDNGPNLIVRFNTAQKVEPVGQPLDFTLFIDEDCNSNTGQPLQNRGVEYRVSYSHKSGYAFLTSWDQVQLDWRWSQLTDLVGFANGNTVTLSIPRNLIGTGQQFCWVGQSSNRTDMFYPAPPRDRLPNYEFVNLTRYQSSTATTYINLEQELAFPSENSLEDSDGFNDNIYSEPVVTLTTNIELKGKLAIPLADGYGFSDVHIISLVDGRQLDQIPNAHQPNFRFDGKKLLTNHSSANGENNYQYDLGSGKTAIVVLNSNNPDQNIFEYDFIEGTETRVSDKAQDTHPFYNPAGNRIVYAGLEPDIDETGTQPSHIFLQCSLLTPHQETDQRCQNLSEFGMLSYSGGQEDEILGSHPVWGVNNTIIYNGCNNWANSTACGIYAVDSRATKSSGNGAVPLRLTRNSSDIPTDSKGNLIAFTSHQNGNWEAYIMNLDGTNVRNISNSPNSNDGLPTISPDGNHVAFVSDRAGQWAIWFVSVKGGPPQKMFDLPLDAPWVNANRVWLDERISWGP